MDRGIGSNNSKLIDYVLTNTIIYIYRSKNKIAITYMQLKTKKQLYKMYSNCFSL